jgi:sulfite exporter TauE/SafE
MCGPFVLSQMATTLDDVPLRQLSELTRLRGAALLPYHAGRMTTYAALGAGAALFSAQFRAQHWFAHVSAALLALAGLIFLFSAFPFLRSLFPSLSTTLPASVFAPLRSLFARPEGWRGYLLGLALGLLPCGLVYAALIAVAARGEFLTAVLGMVVFALGTVPALVLVGMGGQFAFHRFRDSLRYVFPLLMTMNSLTLFAMAGDLIR